MVFSDVILGLYTAEEMGADVTVTDTGEQVVVETPAPQLAVVTKPEVTEAEIVEEAAAEALPTGILSGKA